MSTAPALLVCRLSALGDVVLALPTVHALRRRFPRARIEFLARSPYERILRDVTGLDAVHAWEGSGAPPPAEVTGRRWDVVIDLSGSGRSRRLLARVPRERLLRVRKQSLRRYAYVRLHRFGVTGSGIVPAVERMLATARPLGIDVSRTRPDFGLEPPAADGPVLVAPGAGRDAKRWPVERFAELVRRIAAEQDRDVLVLGGSAERSLLETVAEAAGSRGRAIPCDDPADLPALVRTCALAVTNDSGLLHVAEACGVPVVAVFGPTRPPLGFGPRGGKSVVVTHEIACSPCDIHGPDACPRGHHRCLVDLASDVVYEAVRERLPERVES